MTRSQPAARVLESYLTLHPGEAAQILEVAPPDEGARLLEEAEPESVAGVLESLSPEAASQLLERMSASAASLVLAGLDAAQASILLGRMDPESRNELLRHLPRGMRAEVNEILSFPPGSAGGLMDPRVHSFRPEVRAGEAIERLRRSGRTQIHDVFVVGDGGVLVGVVAVQRLALAGAGDRMESLSRPVPAKIQATAGQEEVAELLDEHPVVTLPVVDFDGRLMGVIRHKALMEAFELEATADVQSMVGAGKEERALSSVSFAVRKRLPWLQINLATAFLAAAVVGLFEDTIARFTALAVLLPVVAGQSGNTGSQALAVTLRGLALREVRLSHWLRVSLKEAGVGAINGVAVALVTALGVFVWSGSAGLCFVIALAMVLSMSIAGITGALIPMVLTAAGQDPAQSSSIVLTTVTDISGFMSFLGLATLFSAML